MALQLSLALAPSTTIHDMPVEVLHQIFEWSTAGELQPHNHRSFGIMAFSIARVCYRWRKIALTPQSQRIWANIAVFHPSPTALELTKIYQQGCGPFPSSVQEAQAFGELRQT